MTLRGKLRLTAAVLASTVQQKLAAAAVTAARIDGTSRPDVTGGTPIRFVCAQSHSALVIIVVALMVIALGRGDTGQR